jgi:ABC-type polysaccharide/polyol phosphate export permease
MVIVSQLNKLWQRRELLYYMVGFQMKAENKNKALGFLWSLLDPLLLLGTYIILVHYIFQRGGPQFPILLFSSLLSWRWFASSLGRSVSSISAKVGLMQSVRFPLIVLPVSGIVVEFFDWVFGFVILLPMLFAFEATFTIHILWLPLLLLVQLIGTVGVCLIFAVWGTYLSDLANIIRFVIRVCFYLSPVLYTVSDRIPAHLINLYMYLNPFAGMLESYKNILVLGLPPSEYALLDGGICCIIFIVGLWFFGKNEHKLVKNVK